MCLRVICIDASKNQNSKKFNNGQEFIAPFDWWLIEREIYNVCFVGKSADGSTAYVLEEQPIKKKDGTWLGFEAFRFIPLSDIDETELVNIKEETCQI